MYDVNYHKAQSVSDAAGKLGGEAKILAGGQTLIPTMKARLAAPSDLIDISGMSELTGIDVSKDNVRIGAATTHAEVAGNKDLAKAIPALATLAGMIGDTAVRHRGTIGGSVANNDPAADYPAACLGLGATIETNSRKISADEFFQGMFETALGEDEMIVAVHFPVPKKAGYAKFRNPASRYAMVGVMVADAADGVRVAVTGAGADGVFRHADMEAALSGKFKSDALDGVATDAAALMSDMHGNAAYRANLVGVMAKRAVDAA